MPVAISRFIHEERKMFRPSSIASGSNQLHQPQPHWQIFPLADGIAVEGAADTMHSGRDG